MKTLRFGIACAVASLASVAHAQVDNAGVLDRALKQYRTAAEGWQHAAQAAAATLFWSLATISLVWTLGQLVLRRAELGEFFGEMIRYLLFTGFWAWMLANGPAHAQLIVESMIKLAGGASGQNMMSPSGVLDVGFQLLDRALKQSTITSPLDSAFGIVMALVILVVLALVGVNMLVALIACWIVAYGGLIVLGFGGSRWTSDMAINYYRMILSLGLQVLAMVLLVGIGESFLHGYFSALEQDVSLHEQAVLLVVSIVLLVTVNRVPALIGTLANGSSPQSALGSGSGPGAVLSTASATGALAATATRPALEGTGQLAKAAAAAAIGGSGAAVASLLDGFRSRGGESSPTPSGGSVFPAPAPPAALSSDRGPNAAYATQSAHAHAPAPHGELSAGLSRQVGHNDRGSERQQAGLPAATESARRPDKPEPGDGEVELRAQPASDEHGSATELAGSEEAPLRHGAPRAPTEDEAPVAGDAAHARSTHAEAASKDEQPRNPTGRAPAEGVSSGPDERAAARLPTSEAVSPSFAASGHGTPAGTFATASPSTAPLTTTPSSQPPISVTSTSRPGQLSQVLPQSVSPAPRSALAAATAQPATIRPDLPFTHRAEPNDAMHVQKRAAVAVPSLGAERADLPAAYSAPVEVDVDAEVAAFRDRE